MLVGVCMSEMINLVTLEARGVRQLGRLRSQLVRGFLFRLEDTRRIDRRVLLFGRFLGNFTNMTGNLQFLYEIFFLGGRNEHFVVTSVSNIDFVKKK